MNKYLFSHNQKGFTLIETLFAILIFSVALVSLMTIAGRGISATTTAREQITAHYLAQEGIEVIRNMRDNNFLTNVSWDDGFGSCSETDPCLVNYNGNATYPTVDSCGGSTCAFVQSSNADFVDTGTDSIYTRKIFVEPLSQDTINPNLITEYRVTSSVVWKSKNINRSVVLQTLITKWQ